jgi:hypothetical protein
MVKRISQVISTTKNLTEETNVDPAADFVQIVDTSANELKKALPNNLGISTGSKTVQNDGVNLPQRGILNFQEGLDAGDDLPNLRTNVNLKIDSLTQETSVDGANDLLVIYDQSATALRAVIPNNLPGGTGGGGGGTGSNTSSAKTLNLQTQNLADNQTEEFDLTTLPFLGLSTINSDQNSTIGIYSIYESSGSYNTDLRLLLNESLTDETLESNTLNFTGITLTTSNVKFGTNAFNFGGVTTRNSITFSDPTSLEGDFRIDLWVRRTSTKTNNSIFDIEGGDRLGLYINSAGSIVLTNTSVIWNTLGSGFITGTYQLLTVSRSGNNLHIFQDGVEISGSPVVLDAGSDTFSSPVLYLGNDTGGAANSFIGEFDSIRVQKGVTVTTNFTVPSNAFTTGAEIIENNLFQDTFLASTEQQVNTLAYSTNQNKLNPVLRVTNTSGSSTVINIVVKYIDYRLSSGTSIEDIWLYGGL